MKHSFYLPALTNDMVERLTKGLNSRFKYGLQPAYDKQTETLSFELSDMGREVLYPNEIGRTVSLDSIRLENISCYVNGFMQAVS